MKNVKKIRFANSNYGGGFTNSKSAFTLIELLAIIIILAIISVITIPVILGVIDKAKQGTIIDSYYGYKDAINNFYIERLSIDSNFKLDGFYIIKNGKLGEYEIPLSGNIPSSGRLYFEDNELIGGNVTIGDYVVTISNNNIKATKGKYVINILSEEQQKTRIDGLYNSGYDEGRLLYRGKKTNNYLILPEKGNDTLYRIMSYEADGTIKVIRDERIGNKHIQWDSGSTVTKVPWRSANFEEQEQIPTRFNDNNTYCKYVGDYYGCNVWGTQNNTYYEGKTLNELYNSFHYKWYPSADATTLNPSNPDLTTTVTQEATLNTLLNREWLPESGLSEYIDNHEFDVGGVYPNSKNLATEKREQASYKWIGKIGLMYITDMVESSTNPLCTSVYGNFWGNPSNSSLQSSGAWPCKNTVEGTGYGNWMHRTAYHEWSLSAGSSIRNSVWRVYQSGHFGYHHAFNNDISVRPVFFLKANLPMIGEGTKSNPYRIVS